MNAIDRAKLLEWTRANLCPLCERVIGIGLEYGALDIKPHEGRTGQAIRVPGESNGRMKPMTDTEKKIAEIREALENCTFPANERLIFVESEEDETTYEIVTERGVVIAKGLDPYDAYLFANAPEWLRFLLSELERLEREYAEERAAHNAHVTELCEVERELDMYKASSEVFYERLKKACEDREKLIDALQTISTDTECPYTSAFAKRELKEIGVVVK